MSPGHQTLAAETIGWVERCLGPRSSVVGARRIGGATGPWRLDVHRPSGTDAVVLRDGDPHSANERSRFSVEAAALQAAEDLRIAAPRLIGHDLTGAQSSRLAVLSTSLPGTNTIPVTATHDRLTALGRAAASLNGIPPNYLSLPLRCRPLADIDFAGERAAGNTTALLRAADDFLADGAPPPAANILVHGDCWQGNLLWQHDRFVGFVDWDAAGIGQPGLDLGNLRFDVALYFGLDGLSAVTQGWYDSDGPALEHLAYWDLLAALSSPTDLSTWTPTITAPGRPDLDTPTLTERRNEFITAALEMPTSR